MCYVIKSTKLWFHCTIQSDILENINIWIEVYKTQERKRRNWKELCLKVGIVIYTMEFYFMKNIYCFYFMKNYFHKKKNILCHEEMFVI